MRLLCITDIHGDRERYRTILDREANQVDVIVLGGDITNFGTPRDADWFIATARQTGKPIVAVAGNCDSAQIDKYLADEGVSVSGYGRIIDSVGFFGVSAAPIWHGTMYEFTEDEIGTLLEAGAAQVAQTHRKVVVSHAPPRDTAVDRVRSGAHVGSTAVREFVEKTQPDLVISGHIHEARGTDQVGKTIVVNCGPAFHGYYAVAALPPDTAPIVELKEV